MNITKLPEFEAAPCCTTCQGYCCKHMACHFAPSDFKEVTYDYLKAKIEEGWISIDWWEADEPQYFLRVRHVNAPIVDPSWGGRCMLLTDTGCSLSFEERPLGAKTLEPRAHGGCIVHYSKEMCKNDWLRYSDILHRLVAHFEEDI